MCTLLLRLNKRIIIIIIIISRRMAVESKSNCSCIQCSWCVCCCSEVIQVRPSVCLSLCLSVRLWDTRPVLAWRHVKCHSGYVDNRASNICTNRIKRTAEKPERTENQVRSIVARREISADRRALYNVRRQSGLCRGPKRRAANRPRSVSVGVSTERSLPLNCWH